MFVINKAGMPTLEAELAELLVRHCLPDRTDDEIKSILHSRHQHQKQRVQSYLTPENLDASHDVLEEDVVKEVKDDLRRQAVTAAARSAPSQPQKEGRQPTKPKPLRGDTFTQGEAKAFLPPTPGCSIHKDIIWHHRWVLKYPRETPPYSTSMTFAKAGAERAALLHVLSWAWDLHEKDFGSPCPWELST